VVFFAKHLVHGTAQVVDFIVVNRHHDDPVLPQQLPRHQQARVNHVEPVGVVTAIGVRVGIDLHTVFGDAGLLPVRTLVLRVLVAVNKVLAGVVGRVDVDAFDLPAVARQQQFQHLKVFAFDDQVAMRLAGVDAAGRIKVEGGRGGGEGAALGVALAVPAEFIALGFTVACQALQLGGVQPAFVGEQVGKVVF